MAYINSLWLHTKLVGTLPEISYRQISSAKVEISPYIDRCSATIKFMNNVTARFSWEKDDIPAHILTKLVMLAESSNGSTFVVDL